MNGTEKKLLDERLARIETNLQRAQKHLARAASLLHEVSEDLAHTRADVTTVTDQVQALGSKA